MLMPKEDESELCWEMLPSIRAKHLITKKERVYFTLCVLSNVIGLLFIFTAMDWYWGALLVIGISALQFFLHGISIARIRVNGIKLTQRQFPDTYARICAMAQRMGLRKVPDVFVIQSDGVLNAFAARFARRNYVVILSSVFELAKDNPDHLDFIIAHELAHIKRRHMTKHMLLGLANLIPFLTRAYSRACEMTCDRMAFAYTGSKVAAVEALIILGAGRRLYNEINLEEYLSQSYSERGFFVWLANVRATHPTLPQRIHAIQEFSRTCGDLTDKMSAPRAVSYSG